MIAHLQELRAGHPVQVPVYDYTIHNRSNQTVLVQPAPVIIVEGILIFDSPELCELMDMKVFVDTDVDVRILRRIVEPAHEAPFGLLRKRLAACAQVDIRCEIVHQRVSSSSFCSRLLP